MSQVCELHQEKEPCRICPVVNNIDEDELADSFEYGGEPEPPKVAEKRPRSTYIDLLANEEDEEDDDPDLAGYLAMFNIDDHAKIAVCRAYANYLAARMRKTKFQRRTKKHLRDWQTSARPSLNGSGSEEDPIKIDE